jgi:hypothetical protein
VGQASCLPAARREGRSVIDEPIAAAFYCRSLVGEPRIQLLDDAYLLIVAIGSG